MTKPALTTSKMPGETEQQYTAWLLYCEAGSLRKTEGLWNRVGQTLGEAGVEFADRLGKKIQQSWRVGCPYGHGGGRNYQERHENNSRPDQDPPVAPDNDADSFIVAKR